MIKITKWPSNWASIFHFTRWGNCCSYGERYPAVFLHPSGSLHICHGISGNGNHFYNHKIDLNKKYGLIIRQYWNEQGGNLIYEIIINGQVVHEKINTKPTVSQLTEVKIIRQRKHIIFLQKYTDSVKVYASDPWHESFTGELFNFGWTTHDYKPCVPFETRGVYPHMFTLPFYMRNGDFEMTFRYVTTS